LKKQQHEKQKQKLCSGYILFVFFEALRHIDLFTKKNS